MRNKEERNGVPPVIQGNYDKDIVNTEPLDIGGVNFNEVSQDTYSRIVVAKEIFRIFPSLKLESQLLISSILSPIDMVTTKITLGSKGNKYIPLNVITKILGIIETRVKELYNIEGNLPKILNEMLVTHGTHATAFIPESSLDTIINNPDYKNFTVEAFNGDGDYITRINALSNYILTKSTKALFKVSDNHQLATSDLNILKIGDITGDELGITSDPTILTVSDMYSGYASESMSDRIYGGDTSTLRSLDTLLKDSETNIQRRVEIKDGELPKEGIVAVDVEEHNKRPSVGQCLKMKLPMESLIPVISDGDPSNHISYIVLIEDGRPLVGGDGSELIRTLENQDASSNASTGGMSLNNAIAELSEMKNSRTVVPVIGRMKEIYKTVIDYKLDILINNSGMGKLSSLKDMNPIYNELLGRALLKKETKLLFLPSELVVNYTIDFKPNGLGVSILEGIAPLLSLRAGLLYSRTSATIKRTTPDLKVSSVIPKNDPDPIRTANQIVSAVYAMHGSVLPNMIFDPDKLSSWSSRLGISFEFDHHRLPKLEIQSVEIESKVGDPDQDLMDELKDETTKAFSLTPDAIEAAESGETATEFVMRDLHLQRRVMMMQLEINPIIGKHYRTIVRTDGRIRDDLYECILSELPAVKRNITSIDKDILTKWNDGNNDDILVKWVFDAVMNTLTAELPSPMTEDNSGLQEALQEYVDELDFTLELLFTGEAFSADHHKDLVDAVSNMKTSVKSVLIRRWMEEKGYLPEVSKLIHIDDNSEYGSDLMDIHNNMINQIIPVIKKFYRKDFKLSNRLTKALNIEEGEEVETSEEISRGDTTRDDDVDDNGVPI